MADLGSGVQHSGLGTDHARLFRLPPNFATYDATYGTLGTLVAFMVWIWISITILIVGAEINAELEHQTCIDSTTGSPRPMGDRGALMADTLGEVAD